MTVNLTKTDMDSAIAALKKEGEERAVMVANTVCIFAPDVPASVAEDVLDGMRLMNLSANKKFDKETQQREWYNFYNDGLGKFGWTLTGAAHVEEAIDKDTHTLATLVPEIVSVQIGHNHRLNRCVKRSFEVIVNTPKAQQLLEESAASVSGKSSTVQISTCEMSPQGLPIMHMTSVQLSYDKAEKTAGATGRTLDKSNTRVYRASQQGSFSIRHFNAMREAVRLKLASQAVDILALDI
ncbi:hypothetical protein ACSFEV_06035 [Pseudomonas fulva]|uniref:hypothetical protein n=1 Tax=Pseudomonas putida group TaxID=136845 RepID=UPI0015F59824|nr:MULTISPECIES: hypothetical protein [Pseudomonas putida group]MBA5705884.1 hypothetical protein [Pseudomonas fulva]MBF8726229.1 hypothetical protein [Pseudomonas putida]